MLERLREALAAREEQVTHGRMQVGRLGGAVDKHALKPVPHPRLPIAGGVEVNLGRALPKGLDEMKLEILSLDGRALG